MQSDPAGPSPTTTSPTTTSPTTVGGFPLGEPVVVLRAPSPRDPLERRTIGHALVRDAAALLCGADARSFRVDASCPTCGGAHGRPLLSRADDGARFGASVTHANGVTLAVAAHGDVGIDAEPLDGPAERFAAIREVTGRGVDVAPDGELALRLWTTIEAVLKADGRGLTVDPRDVSVDGSVPVTTARIPAGAHTYAVETVTTADGLVVSVALAQRRS